MSNPFNDPYVADALKTLKTQRDPVKRHFAYSVLIDYYYRQRDKIPGALELCTEYCRTDIKHIDAFIKGWIEQERALRRWAGKDEGDISLPHVIAFDHLIVIYDREGKYQKAIEVCNLAIHLGLKNRTKGGYPAKLAKLNKKLPRVKD